MILTEEALSIQFTDIQPNDMIKYKLPGESEYETAQVISRAGKMTGKNRFWWNGKTVNTGLSKSLNSESLIDLSKVDHIESSKDKEESFIVVISRYRHSEDACVAANERELLDWERWVGIDKKYV